jgi:hypothetical protein
MANQLGIIHPAMLAKVQPNFYPASCTIQQATTVADSYGQPIPTWANLADHVDLSCRLSPGSPSSGDELRTQIQIYTVHMWIIALNGHYPDILETMRAVIDGTVYEIEQVQHDGNEKTTRLRVRTLE